MQRPMPWRRTPGPVTRPRRWLCSLAVLSTLGGGIAGAASLQAQGAQGAQQSARKPEVDPKARAELEKMSDFLGGQRRFSVQADGSTQVVLETGEKLDYTFSSTVRVQRPDRLRSDRRGELADLEFYYDGRTFNLFGKKAHYYATASAPSTLDEALDAARERLGIEAPGADLLYSNSAEGLLEDVVSGTDLGMSIVDGVPCRHLAFRGNETDWQIWIEEGRTPVPRKYVIVSKKEEGSPQFDVELSGWDFSPDFNDAVFRFTPPADAQRIDFLGTKPQPGKQGGTK